MDGQAAALNNNTTTLTRRPQTVRGAGRAQHPDQWQNFTEVNIAKAERERDNSKNLRSVTDGVLRQTTGLIFLTKLEIKLFLEDQLAANNLTTFQFKERIADTKRAKKEFEDNLDKVSFTKVNDRTLTSLGYGRNRESRKGNARA